jgi:hypothetical protein
MNENAMTISPYPPWGNWHSRRARTDAPSSINCSTIIKHCF